MFDLENGKIVHQKFISTLEENIRKLRSNIKNQRQNKEVLEALIKYEQTADISYLLACKDSAYFSPEIRDSIKKIEFLERHNITTAPQYLKAKQTIIESDESKSASERIQKINQDVKNTESRISIITKVIKKEANANELSVALSSSGLTSEEQLVVLKTIVYEDCLSETKRKETIVEQATEDKSLRVDELREKISETIEELSSFIADNYKYIEGQSKEQIKFKSMISFFTDDNYDDIDIKDIKDVKEYLQVLLIKIIDKKSGLENVIEEQLANPTEEELLLIEEMNNEAKNSVVFGNKLVVAVEEIDKEKEEAEPSNIIILNDRDGNPLVDITRLDSNDAKNLSSIFKKLENGQYDYIKGIKHSRVLTDGKIKENIYVNRKDKKACSYVRLTDDMVLVLCYAELQDVYDQSKRIYLENKDTIEDMVKLARSDIETFKEKYVSSKGGKRV